MTAHSGMADAGRDEVGGRVLAAWDAFLDQAASVDLQLIDSSGAVVEAAVVPRLGVVRIR